MIFACIVLICLNLNLQAQSKNEFRTTSLSFFSELQQIRYYNFQFLPSAYAWGLGVHVYKDIFCSGEYFALGANASASLAKSAQLENAFAYDIALNTFARLGFIESHKEHSTICLKSGIGVEFYRGLETSYTWRNVILPSYFFAFEVMAGRPIFLRYNRMLAFDSMIKQSWEIGIILPL